MKIFFTMIGLCWCLAGAAQQNDSTAADSAIIMQHLVSLCTPPVARNGYHIERLDQAAGYIDSVFKIYADSVQWQNYKIYNNTFHNIIASFGTENKRRIVIGAHYDVCSDQPGADDNASGVSALLELARMLQCKKLKYRIDLVAYSLEEPPNFGSQNMGSYVHAKWLHDHKTDVYGMISLEMIGYYSHEPHSQHYPSKILEMRYGNKGDFITLVKRFGAGRFARQFSKAFMAHKHIRTVDFTGPRDMQDLYLSDHINYWAFGYSAMMITDTSDYRNPHYHQISDTIDTLDIGNIKKVINSIADALMAM